MENFPFKSSVPYLDIKAIEKGGDSIFVDPESSNLTNDNELLVVWDGARAGWVGKSRTGAIGSTIMALRPKINRDYLFRFLQTQFDYIQTNHRGTGIPHVDPNLLWNIKVPLAPLAEQQRIVAKLDELMERIDRSRARLERIPKILKRFRQSVLSAAVSGKLTEEWRETCESITGYKEGFLSNTFDFKRLYFPDSWKWDYLTNLGKHKLGKMLDRSKNIGELTYYLRNISVRWFDFDLTNLSMIRATKEDKEKFNVRDGDVFICEGGEPGRAAVWSRGENGLIFQKAIHRIRLNQSVNPYWLLYNLKVDADNGSLEQLFTGSGIKHLTLKSLAKYQVPVPSIEEQMQIVQKVTQLLSIADQIENRYNKAKAQLDKLPQSLLAKAFRGELVPQDENDEPASVLLERIKAGSELLSGRKSKRKEFARV